MNEVFAILISQMDFILFGLKFFVHCLLPTAYWLLWIDLESSLEYFASEPLTIKDRFERCYFL